MSVQPMSQVQTGSTTPMPSEADDFPWSTQTPGTVATDGVPSTGRIEIAGDGDMFQVLLVAGTTYRFALDSDGGVGGLDPMLTLLDPAGQTLATDRDSAGSKSTGARLTFTPTSTGTYYLGATDEGVATGAYRLAATAVVAPVLTGLLPADDAADVPVWSNLQLSFSQPVQAGQGAVVLHNADGSVERTIAISDHTQVNFSGNALTINPTGNLVGDRGYYLTIDAGAIVSLDGVPFAGLAGSTAYNFRTLAATDDYPAIAPGQVTLNGSAATGHIEVLGDTDDFAVQLQAGNVYSFALDRSAGETGLDPMLSLVDPAGQVVASDLDSGGSKTGTAQIVNFTPATSGLYYLRAADEAGGTGTYRLDALDHGASRPDDHTHLFDTSAVLTTDGVAATGSIERAHDTDMFKVSLSAGTRYTFTLAGDSNGLQSPHLLLWPPHADGSSAVLQSASGTGSVSIAYTATVDGDYYVAADGAGLAGGGYSLTATGIEVPILVGTTPADDAADVPVSSNLRLTFSQPVTAGQGTIDLVHANGNVALSIPASDSSQISFDGSTVTLDPPGDLQPGRGYYIRIQPGAIVGTNGAAFAGLDDPTRFNFTTAGSPPPADDYPWSTGTTGQVATDGTPSTGTIEVAGDSDMFRVPLQAGQTYVFKLESDGSAGGLDPLLTLLNPAGKTVATDTDSGGSTNGAARITYTAPTTGTYYLGATDETNTATGGYRVFATAATAPTLTDMSPADDATGVPVDANLTLTFSQPVQAGNGAIVVYRADGSGSHWMAASDTTQVQFNGNSVTINPAADLLAGRDYFVGIDTGAIVGSDGAAFAGLGGTSAYNFSTAAPADDYPWSTSTPGQVATDGTSSTGRIQFAGDGDMFAVQLQAGQSYVFKLESDGSAGGFDPLLTLLDPSGVTLAIDYDGGGSKDGTARLSYTAPTTGTYYLGAADEGSAIGGYRLTAGATPLLTSVSPADDATDVPVSSNLQLTFSQPVMAGQGWIRLHNGDGSVARSIWSGDTAQVQVNGNTVTIDPSSDLTPGQAYYLTIDAGAFVGTSGLPFAGLSDPTAHNFHTLAVADDFPWATSTAGVVTVDSAATRGRIEMPDDADMFAVQLQQGVTYTFTLAKDAASPGNLNPQLLLLNSAGQQERIAFDTFGSKASTDAQIHYTPTTSGTYYLGAMDEGRGFGAYQLSATSSTVPFLVGAQPADNSTGYFEWGSLALRFSEPVFPGQGDIVLYANGVAQRTIPVTDPAQLLVSGEFVFMVPRFELAPGTAYHIGISPGAFVDATGNAFAGLTTTDALNFTTRTIPGDDFASNPEGAAVLPIGGTRSGHIDDYSDRDLFRVDLVAGRSYTFSVQADAGHPELGVQVDNGIHPFTFVEYIGGTSTYRLHVTAATSGAHYLKASNWTYDPNDSTHNNYQVAAVAITDDFLASAGTTGRLALNGAASRGEIQSPADADRFKVALTAGRMYHIDLSGLDAPLDTRLGVYNEAGMLLAGNHQGLGFAAGTTHVTFIAPSTGNYFVEAATENGATGRYQVRASTATDTVPAAWTTPASVTVDAGPRLGHLEFTGDADFYKVDLTAGVKYDFELLRAGEVLAPDLRLALYSPTKAQLVANDGGSKADPQFSYTPTTSGTYYLRASDVANGIGSYAIAVDKADVAGPVVAQLDPVDGGVISRTDDFVIRFDGAILPGTGSIVLRSSSGAAVASYDIADYSHVWFNGSTLTLHTGIELAAASDFYMEIGAGTLRDSAGNAFAGLVGSSAYNFTTATDDHDARGANLAALSVGGSAVSGAIEVANDVDRFKLDLVAGQTIQILLTETSDSHGSVTLFTPDLGWLSQANGWLTYKALNTGTHYLDIALADEKTGSYTVEVDLAPGSGSASAAVELVGQATGEAATWFDHGA
ncbi:Ig-like domain-containing protein [Aquincola sp. S2]|uniref:Ig-like domain-containing protein n=1 Tax=Pseudaquabacterium terrae TaxID=2732868 RepID=A0ABX2ENS8_9BURK|nr:Ig-like domain-containing protein [Aquabacterium terrae]NRF70350.1 Ig-like domain-containing protein [Aquabacterium terrae]